MQVAAGLYLSLISAITIGAIAGVWYYLGSDPSTVGPHDNVAHSATMFSIAVAIGQFCAGMSACASGAAAPILFKAMHFDPANLAGPLETAFQDVIGSSILLAFSAWFLDATGAGPQCPAGNWTICQQNCVTNATFRAIFVDLRGCDVACDTFC